MRPRSAKHPAGGHAAAISITRRGPALKLARPLVLRAVRLAADDRQITSLSIALVKDHEMGQLHAQYMGDPSPTDVLTFDLRDETDGQAIEGEIVVSVETAGREAAQRGLPVAEETMRYIVHGVLHLVGYDDATPAQRRTMRRREDEVLAQLGQELSSTRGSGRARAGRKRVLKGRSC